MGKMQEVAMNIHLPKVTTATACKIVRLDRDRFNEAVAAGYLPCVPETIPGRARLFLPDDLLSLWFFRSLMEDGFSREMAGYIACAVAKAARHYPDAPAISYVETYFKGGAAYPAHQVPDYSQWEKDGFTFEGTDIRKVTTFRVSKVRELIAHHTAVETSTFGPED